MDFVDPFSVDTGRFKQFLREDSKSNEESIEYAEAVPVEDILNKGTVKGLPPSAFKAVKDAQAKLAANKEKKQQVAQMFNNLFQDLNTKYGLSVSFDFDSFSNSLNYIIEPKNKLAAEYYLSEAYGRFRTVLYGQYLQAIAMLSAQILDPAYLLSDSMTYDQKLDTMQKLYEFMRTSEEIYEKVKVPDTAVKLEKLSTDNRQSYSLDDPSVQEFMASLFSNVKDQQKQLEDK